MEPRAELEEIVQRLSGKHQEGDVHVETAVRPEGGFCSRVTLTPLGCIHFTGEVCEKEEDAEFSAVLAALEEFAAVGRLAAVHVGGEAFKRDALQAFWEMGAAAWEGAKRHCSGPMSMSSPMPVGAFRAPFGGPVPPVGRATHLVRPSPLLKQKFGGVAAEGNPKSELSMVLTRILGRSPTKDDQVYNTAAIPAGFVTTLKLNLGNNVGSSEFQGAPRKNKKDAEQAAAAAALEEIRNLAPAGPPVKKAKSVPQLPTAALQGGILPGGTSPAASPRILPQDDPELISWQQARLEDCDKSEVQDRCSLDLWYGQICLACLIICPKSQWAMHAVGQKHKKQLDSRPVRKRALSTTRGARTTCSLPKPCLWPELPRPPTEPSRDLLPASMFVEMSGWTELDSNGKHVPVLLVGEMDYSFSLAVARLRSAGAPLVATSYLEEHDPNEPEFYPSDDGERAAYQRRSLPAMKGDLFRNLEALKELGAEVRHGVDAMNLNKTLRSQGIGGAFQRVVFPFPRASLQRACDPRNSRLLRNFFYSATKEGFVIEGGVIQLVMLSSQYEEWDVAGMAAEAGLELLSRVQLPSTFYQSREMSGKPWTPQGAELLNFGAAF